MKSLFWSYNLAVKKSYIIRIKNNLTSENLAKRCFESCSRVGQNVEYWDAFDGTGKEIIPPQNVSDVMGLIKITDHYMTKGEVACALSHISLWNHCVLIDEPIVIFEHDAVMVRPYNQHAVFNSICFLGSQEQTKLGWNVYATPPHASDGPNKHFICRAHAYAIDPAVAKNMLAHVIKFGITDPLDILIRADLFPIYQMGVFAYDESGGYTTILNRPKEGRTTKRNDKLEI